MTEEASMIDTELLPDEIAPEAKEEVEKETPEVEEEEQEEAEQDDKEPDGEPEEEKKKRRPSRRDREIAMLRQQNERIERQLAELAQQRAQPQQELVEPDQSDFVDYDQYLKARDEYSREMGRREAKAQDEQARQKEAERRTAEDLSRRAQTMAETGAKKYEDFAEVAFNPSNFDPSEQLAQLIIESDMAADVAYHLGSNPDEAQRLETMTPTAAAREIGRIEARLSQKPARKPTAASPPVPTVKKGGSPERDPEKMSFKEYEAYRMGG